MRRILGSAGNPVSHISELVPTFTTKRCSSARPPLSCKNITPAKRFRPSRRTPCRPLSPYRHPIRPLPSALNDSSAPQDGLSPQCVEVVEAYQGHFAPDRRLRRQTPVFPDGYLVATGLYDLHADSSPLPEYRRLASGGRSLRTGARSLLLL